MKSFRGLIIAILLFQSTIFVEIETHSHGITEFFFQGFPHLSYREANQIESLNYISHSSIYINSNSDFESYSFPGNGSEVNPYLIDGLNITTDNSTAIFISDVTAYFIIQNCFLDAEDNGITLWYVSDSRGKIINNTCCNNNEDFGSHGEIISYGIEINESPGTFISENICYNNNRAGIFTKSSHGCIIQNNTCFDHPYSGILIAESNYTIIINNICYSNQEGIEISNSWMYDESCNCIIKSNLCYANEYCFTIDGYNNTVELNTCQLSEYGIFSTAYDSLILQNICTNNTVGLYVDYGRITLENNTCINNKQGLYADCSYSYIKGNYVVSNQNSSIITGRAIVVYNNTFSNSELNGLTCNIYYGIIVFNTFEDNLDLGLYLIDNDNSIIHHNNFIDNNLGGESQAHDNGRNNVWYSKDKEEGNFWSDWSGEGSYGINGPANAVDKYPLDSCYEILGDLPEIPEIPDPFEDFERTLKIILTVLYSVIGISVIGAIFGGIIVLRKYLKRKNKNIN